MPFIDPKKSVKFTLVHRSQRDPELLDHEASDLVLAPIAPSANLLKVKILKINSI